MNLRKCKTCMHTPHVQHILMHTDNQHEINGMQKSNTEIAWRGDSPGIRKQASVPFSNMANRMHTVIAPLLDTSGSGHMQLPSYAVSHSVSERFW